jgi:hypothetical protein
MELVKKTERGNTLSTKEYRKLNGISYSDIRLFIQDRRKFYQEKILGEIGERKDTASTIMGDMVHTLLLEPDKFDQKFVLPACTPPVGQMKDLCDNLYTRTVRSMDENGKVTMQMSELLELAIQDTKYNGKGEEVAFKGKGVEKIVEMFTGAAEMYYKELRDNHGRTVVSTMQIEKAELIANEMRENPWTSKYLIDQPGEESHNELPVVFTYKGVELRGMLDRITVSHEKKKITPSDVKSSWDIESFDYSYVKNCYYIQAAMYDLAASAWATQQGIGDYTIEPMTFLSCDTRGYMQSIPYTLTGDDIGAAMYGFTLDNGKHYQGLLAVLKDIKWAIDNGKWNVSKDVYQDMEKKGHTGLGIVYKQTTI